MNPRLPAPGASRRFSSPAHRLPGAILFLTLGHAAGLGLAASLLFAPAPAAAAEVSASAPPLRLGFAQADITPPAGYRMYGSFQEVFGRGTHDPLLVKALVLEQGPVRVGLVACDLGFVSRNLTTPARERAAARTGIPASSLVLLATQTRTGPDYDGVQRDLRHFRALREHGTDLHEPVDLLRRMVDTISDAIATAASNARPATLEIIRTRQDGLAFNRRHHLADGSVVSNPSPRDARLLEPAGPIDGDLPCLIAREAGSRLPLGSLTVFALTVGTSSGDPCWGADYPGILASRLERHFRAPPEPVPPVTRPPFVSLFAPGTAGDVHHLDVTRDAPPPGLGESVRVGNALAATLLAALPRAQPLVEPRLRMRSAVVEAPLVELTPEQIARSRELLERHDRSGGIAFGLLVDACRVLDTERLRRRFGDRLPLEVNALALDRDTALVFLPHAVFVRIGLAIKDRSPFRHTLVTSLAHDLDFGILDRQGYAEGGDEALGSSLKPGAGEFLTATALELLRGLHGALHGVGAPGRSYE